MILLSHLSRLVRNTTGSIVVETAFVAPILATLAFGGFEASRIVSRNAEMQSAAAEAAAIVLAANPKTESERNTIEDVVEKSTGLADAAVTFTLRYRCGTDADLKNNSGGCGSNKIVSEYIIIKMTDTYTPAWADFGIGSAVTFDVERKVQIG